MDNPRTFNLIVLLHEGKIEEFFALLNQIEPDAEAAAVLLLMVLNGVHHKIIHKLLDFCTTNNIIEIDTIDIIIGAFDFNIIEYLMNDGYIPNKKVITKLKESLERLEANLTTNNVSFKIITYTKIQNIKRTLTIINKLL